MTEHYTTTEAGAPAPSDSQSLTVGPNGPILLQDHYLLEQMAMFNRERTPERQPHAKGGGAFGRLEVTADVSAYTRAAEAAVGHPGHPGRYRDRQAGSRANPVRCPGRRARSRDPSADRDASCTARGGEVRAIRRR
ncbi:hypothetical protein A5710_06410 [Mycolicibacter sinensis]|uniref:Catalase core domain-containing protein n=1 Tax=Mycolicibacter sinensis (strain JDM601) TaxID=875328 RepID=A0A1A2XMD4_MYCSD|nr:hypothetical protein A5710_06410 [Mycolicibacter sinensis]